MNNTMQAILVITMILFGFQNCSEVKFGETDPLVNKLGDGESLPDPDSVIIDDDGNLIEIGDGEEGGEEEGEDVAENDPDYDPDYNPGEEGDDYNPNLEQPNYNENESEHICERDEEHQYNEAMKLYTKCFVAPNFVDKVASDKMGGDLDQKNKFLKLMAYKNINKLSLKNVKKSIALYKDVVEVSSAKNLSGIIKISATRAIQIQHSKGYLCLAAEEIGEMDNIKGVTVLRGNSENGGVVGTLKNIRGPLILKDLSVEKIDNMKGVLILVNSEVMELKNFKGIVKKVDL